MEKKKEKSVVVLCARAALVARFLFGQPPEKQSKAKQRAAQSAGQHCGQTEPADNILHLARG